MTKTYGEWFKEALNCKTKGEAEQWFKAEVASNMQKYGYSENEATHILASNLGYMTGYYGKKEAQKIYDLFGIGHPIFGGALITTEKEGEE